MLPAENLWMKVRSCCADGYQGYAPLDLHIDECDASEAQPVGAPIASSGAVQTVTESTIGSRPLPAASGSGPQQAGAGHSVRDCLTTMTTELDNLDELDNAPADGGGGLAMGSHGFHNLDADAVRVIPQQYHRCSDQRVRQCRLQGCLRTMARHLCSGQTRLLSLTSTTARSVSAACAELDCSTST